MICLDTSKSMEEDADFPDMNSIDNVISEDDEPELVLPQSDATWSSEEAQGILLFDFSNSEHLSKCDYFQDILGLVNIAGPVRNRRIAAQDALEELVTTYCRMARPLIEANLNYLLRKLELVEFIDSIKRGHVKTSLVEYLVQQSANKTLIIKAGPTPSPNVGAMSGTIPRVDLRDERY